MPKARQGRRNVQGNSCRTHTALGSHETNNATGVLTFRRLYLLSKHIVPFDGISDPAYKLRASRLSLDNIVLGAFLRSIKRHELIINARIDDDRQVGGATVGEGEGL